MRANGSSTQVVTLDWRKHKTSVHHSIK